MRVQVPAALDGRAELFLANRNSKNESPTPSTYQQSSQLRIYWTLFSDGGVNALVRTGP